MRMAGVEPARCHHRQILSLLRLPFRHIRELVHDNRYLRKMQMFFAELCKNIFTALSFIAFY